MSDFSTEVRVIIFTDVHSFSRLMIELGDRYPEFVQAYYERSGDSIVGHGGQIIKYIGDSVLATFPEGCEVAAVECGIDMRSRYASLMKEYGAETESDLEIGIGVGEIIVGTFGHSTLRTLDILGDKVNEVAIIMHHRGVAVTDDVKNALEDRFTLVKQPDVTPKWSDKTVSIWDVS